MSKRVSVVIKSPEEARELYCIKFQHEISKEKVNVMMEEFKRYDMTKSEKGDLHVNETLLLFEARGKYYHCNESFYLPLYRQRRTENSI